jgi:L-ribulose-5-phosphate 3-epimerase
VEISRRTFLQGTPLVAVAGARELQLPKPPGSADQPFRGTLCLFSKCVPQLRWRELGQRAKDAGFGGIDLTVRRGGHVLPERAAADLPRAVAEIRESGVEVPMITTGLLTADDRTAEPILSTAGKLSIPFVKPGYYRYKLIDVIEEADDAGKKLRGLVKLAAKHGVQVGYHNHPRVVGAPIWDIARAIETMDARWCGYYYDLAQATMEGGDGGWKISANLVQRRLKMVAAKDFVWKQMGPHRWEDDEVALGKGVSQWREFAHLLAQSNFHGPVSLQQEYAIPGVAGDQGIALSKATIPSVMAEAGRNRHYLAKLLREAYEGVS